MQNSNEKIESWPLSQLESEWAKAACDEREARERRREIEDAMVARQDLPKGYTGRKTLGSLSVIHSRRYKVDTEQLQRVASEAGVLDALGTLFRWRAEVAVTSWLIAPDELKEILSEAVTEEFLRPTWRLSDKIKTEVGKRDRAERPKKLSEVDLLVRAKADFRRCWRSLGSQRDARGDAIMGHKELVGRLKHDGLSQAQIDIALDRKKSGMMGLLFRRGLVGYDAGSWNSGSTFSDELNELNELYE